MSLSKQKIVWRKFETERDLLTRVSLFVKIRSVEYESLHNFKGRALKRKDRVLHVSFKISRKFIN